MTLPLNNHGQRLQQLLQTATSYLNNKTQKLHDTERVHVAGAGGTVTAAYEQLRNAAENAEEHVLLQRAIRRFYRRLFLTRDDSLIKKSGEELVLELTLAGYLENDTIPASVLTEISTLAVKHYEAYELLQKSHGSKQAEHWSLDVLAVNVEWLFNDPAIAGAYTQFVHDYYVNSGKAAQIFQTKPNDFETGLYVAIERALLKADIRSVRAGLLTRYGQSPNKLDEYVQTNEFIDTLLDSPTVETLFRYIDRRGAPLRILKRMIDDDPGVTAQLTNQNQFLSNYEQLIGREYESINRRITRGIIKSVIFLIITKFLIGLAIEIPYDYLVHGAIIWLPLIINLFFPPVYMILLRGTLMLPSPANTTRLVQQTEQMLYGAESKQLERKPAATFGAGYNVAYGLAFVIVFGGLGYLLYALFSFELLHLFIFFLFLSGASFLGFRLSRLIREVEAIDADQNAVTTARDFLYMPFVVVGRYMSEKYAQVNVVALTLDMLIELPLKTILRLIRQWGAFIGSKQDQL